MAVMTTPAPPHKENLPRVTILCGFLGAGKTTLIRHLLAQADGRRWAVVVNDLASLNVDAALVRRDTTANAGTGASPGEVVELGNGCVCCTGRDDLGEAIARLAAEGDYAHILVETTGVAEPRGLASLFTRRSAFGRSVADWAQLSALVTVIDVPAAARRWRGEPTTTSPDVTATAAPRSVDELLLEQIEVADVIVLNKLDAATPDDLALVRAALPGLNARAELIETERGQVPAEWLLGRNRFDPAATLASATWITALNAAPTTPPAPPPGPRATRVITPESRYGIRSFVWQSRRPLRRDAWRALLARGWPGLLRAKGFFWETEQPDEMGFVSVAGGTTTYEFLNYWWAAMITAGRIAAEARPPAILALWQEPHGDRRQEIVFIGVALDEACVRRELEACLTPTEPPPGPNNFLTTDGHS